MTHRVIVQSRAARDADVIFEWLLERSFEGATAWFEAYLSALESLRERPERCALAEESPIKGREVRQLIFRTSRGRPYRLHFVIRASEVRVLHVRGPGQSPLGPS